MQGQGLGYGRHRPLPGMSRGLGSKLHTCSPVPGPKMTSRVGQLEDNSVSLILTFPNHRPAP